MGRTDLISDVFTIIRNAVMAKKEDAMVPYSKIVFSICDILKKEGYIENFKEVNADNLKRIKVYLRYQNGKSVINGIKRISKPGRRVYLKNKGISKVLHGYGIALVSTSKGVLTDKSAKESGFGGEYVGEVW